MLEVVSTERKEVYIKVALVGDSFVGKSTLVESYLDKENEKTVPKNHVVNIYTVVTDVQKYRINLEIVDNAGVEEFGDIRSLLYPNTNVVLLCYNSINATTFGNVENVWYKDIKEKCPTAKVILIGTHNHLQERYPEKAVTQAEANELSQRLGFYCSWQGDAAFKPHAKSVFDLAIRCGLEQQGLIPKKNSASCVQM